MKHPPEEQTRISALLNAFEGYLAGNRYLDIFYSTKHGYLAVHYDCEVESGEFIRTAADLFELLLMEISSDVRDLFLCGDHTTVDLYPAEIRETRRRLQPYLDQLPADLRQHFVAYAEAFFQNCDH